ncbi:MAG: LicD family protein [Sulfurimonadaceae bacterium]
MTQEIITDNGIYRYEEIELYAGKKKLDREIAKRNLLDFKKVMDTLDVRYGLMYGTLLGAVREGNFIVHDEDIDIFVLVEDRSKVLNALFEIEKLGFKVARYKYEDLLSIIRDDEYIDLYFFRKYLGTKRRIHDNLVDAKYLEHTETIDFLGENFPVPGNPEQLLEVMYGKDWKIPNIDSKPTNYSYDVIVKQFIIEKFPFIYNIYKFFKK